MNGHIRQRDLRNGIKGTKRFFKTTLATLLGEGIPKLEVNTQIKPASMKSVEKRYLSRLSVDPVHKSSLINIKFRSFDAEKSARIVNEHLKAYIWLTAQRRYESTSGAKVFLEGEIANVQQKLSSSQKELTEFARTNGVIDTEDRDNIMIERLAILNQELSNVQSERIDAETLYIQSQSSDADDISIVVDDGLIKTLRQDHAELSAEYYRQSKIYKADYPVMAQMRAKLNELELNIQSQANKKITALKTNFEQLSLREDQLNNELQEFKTQMLDLQDKSVQYNILKRELDANKTLYAGLLERTKEVGVAVGVELNVASVVDEAQAPNSPISPNLTKSLMNASVIGLFLSFGIAFLLAMLDNRVSDVTQLRKLTNLNHLGITPKIESTNGTPTSNKERIYMYNTMAHYHPASQFSEAMQSVRTSLSCITPQGMPKSIMITSALAGEGKSTIAMNLAVSYAKSGMKVMLIDTDMRRSRHHDVFNFPVSPGLSEYLTSAVPVVPYGFKEIKGLSMIVSGDTVESPVDLLRSPRMIELINRCEQDYDLVVVDTPPVSGIADSTLVATLVESVLFVVGADQVPQDAVKQAIAQLQMVNAPIIGTIFNNAVAKPGYYTAYSFAGKDEKQARNMKVQT